MEPPRFSLYDAIADDYVTFVRDGLRDSGSVLALATQALFQMSGATTDLDVCDLACGEGHLTRMLAPNARNVIGVDFSGRLLEQARQQTTNHNVRFVHDDVQYLSSLPNAYFDLVVSNLALMDIPDLSAVYQSVARVLRSSGRFVFSITHPCYQAPHAYNQVDSAGQSQARVVPNYVLEGAWASGNKAGIRGKVGAFHRTFSTYLNQLQAADFQLESIHEPVAADEQIPPVLAVAASMRNKHNE